MKNIVFGDIVDDVKEVFALLRLKEARKAKGLTQVEVSKIIGISQNGYSDWETGKNRVDAVSLNKLADLYGVSVDYLVGGREAPTDTVLRIPVLGSVPAGIPLEAIEDIIDWEEIPQSLASGGKEYFALQVEGDSMYPDYLPGDIVIVQKTPVCASGDDCVVYVNGYDATLKQVRLDEKHGTLTIVPKNPSYPPRTFSKEEIQSLPVTIAGVVVELRRKVGRK
ncbi:MAG: LexA family transcriptional regulator [Candidatus Limivicinus sp.]|nr:LexA family transcriptional regulator [Candidatus Limivicinus sp.]